MADTFQTEIAHVASVWRTAALAARPPAKKHIELTANEWVDAMQSLVDQFETWTLYEQRVALGMMKEVVRRVEARAPGDRTIISLPTTSDVHDEIDIQLKAYDHLRWIGHEIIDAFSRPVERTGSARRAHAARTWFQQGVLSRVSKAEFEHESAEKRTGAIAELDWVRVELEQGRNPATGKRVEASGYELLPGLADLSHFHALNALLDDVDRMRRAAEARVVRDALMDAAQAAGGAPGIDKESQAVDEAVGKVPWWTHRAERAELLGTVRRALADLKDAGPTPDINKKRVAIVATLNELRLSTDRAQAHGVTARSLAHSSASRVELSSRQQVQYGRRFAGL